MLPQPMLETFFAGRQHPIPVMIGSNSDEASVMAVFGVDIAGQIQKLRRRAPSGAGADQAPLSRREGAMKRWGGKYAATWPSPPLVDVVMQAQQRVGQPCWRYWFDYVAGSGA